MQRVYAESYVTNLSLPLLGNVHGRRSHLSSQSAELNVMMLQGRGFSQTDFVISIPESGQNML